MTSDNRIQDFLFIHYKYKDFIIDRKQFSRSVSFNSLKTIDKDWRYLSQIIEYGKEKILNFDLDSFLENTFKVEIDNLTKLCIIANLDQLSVETGKVLKEILNSCENDISKDAISFSISSKSEIKKYSLDNFKNLSGVYNKAFIEKGILSCFFNNNRIQYLIDIDKFLYNSLTESKEF